PNQGSDDCIGFGIKCMAPLEMLHVERVHSGAVPCARPLRDALRVLATVRYNPASSYPSSEEAKRSLLAWMACKSRQRSVDGGVLLSRGSGVRFLPGAPKNQEVPRCPPPHNLVGPMRFPTETASKFH